MELPGEHTDVVVSVLGRPHDAGPGGGVGVGHQGGPARVVEVIQGGGAVVKLLKVIGEDQVEESQSLREVHTGSRSSCTCWRPRSRRPRCPCRTCQRPPPQEPRRPSPSWGRLGRS